MIKTLASAAATRNRVLWFGPPPANSVAREFATRNLVLDFTQTTDFATASGAVFVVVDGDEGALDVLQASAAAMVDNGLLLCIGAASDALQGKVATFVKGLSGTSIFRRTAPEGHEFAERIARHDAGPAHNRSVHPELPERAEPLRREDALLIGRAFNDCGALKLEGMGGMSGARVFSVHATMGNSVGSWAQPWFAKLDRLAKIEREAENYRQVAPFIPFGLRPNIERIVRGSSRGLMVGNLVEKSEALWDVARRGHAGEVIFNLFNTTLGGLRAQGLREAAREGSVFAAMRDAGVFRAEKFRDEYRGAASAYAAVSTLDVLCGSLAARRQIFRWGPIHGDLHADNVRVRGSDAIVIDFASATHGPLAADLALLETWLAFAVHRQDMSETYEDVAWLNMIKRLYAAETFTQPPLPAEGPMRFAWIWDSVRHIRTIGLSTESSGGEYESAVIAALLRRCMFLSSCAADKFRRACAYTVACELAQHLELTLRRHAA